MAKRINRQALTTRPCLPHFGVLGAHLCALHLFLSIEVPVLKLGFAALVRFHWVQNTPQQAQPASSSSVISEAQRLTKRPKVSVGKSSENFQSFFRQTLPFKSLQRKGFFGAQKNSLMEQSVQSHHLTG